MLLAIIFSIHVFLLFSAADIRTKQKELLRYDAEDSRLLELVRRLSTDHVKMGANVSRYSSKGLSGRRSQSSGSICNGKGRHGSTNDNKICGSLPSYLDDKNKGCNNNLVCEKPPLDEVSDQLFTELSWMKREICWSQSNFIFRSHLVAREKVLNTMLNFKYGKITAFHVPKQCTCN